MFDEIGFVIVDRSYDYAVQRFCEIRGVIAGNRENVVSASSPFARGRERIRHCILWKQEELSLFERSTVRWWAVDVIGGWLVIIV